MSVKTKTRKKRATRTVLCEACGCGFSASASHNAKTCSPACRNMISDMGQRALVLGPLGIQISDGLSDRGLPTIFYEVPVASWPAIEVAAAKKGIPAHRYLDGFTRFRRDQIMRRVAAEQAEALLYD